MHKHISPIAINSLIDAMCQHRTYHELLFNLMNLSSPAKVERTIFIAIRFYNSKSF